MRKFLKSNKGNQVVEYIIILPIMLFLILFTVANFYSFGYSSRIESVADTCVRRFVVRETLDDALLNLYDYIEGEEATVTDITLYYYNSSEVLTSVSLTFSTDETATTYFTSSFMIAGSNTWFNSSLFTNYDVMNNNYEQGNFVTITLYWNISKFVNSLATISLYNVTTKKNDITLDYGVSGSLTATARGVIIG